MKRAILSMMIACLGTFTPLRAQFQIGLDQLASKAKDTKDITLDGTMLQMAGKFLSGQSDDSKLKNLLANLKTISVKSFQFAGEGEYRQEDLQPVRAQLQSPGWSKLIGSRNARESSDIYAKSDGSHIVGIAVIAAQPKELTVVYIEGAISLSDLADLAGHFGIPKHLLPGDKNNDKDKTKGNQ
jgi:hypothetical protein